MPVLRRWCLHPAISRSADRESVRVSLSDVPGNRETLRDSCGRWPRLRSVLPGVESPHAVARHRRRPRPKSADRSEDRKSELPAFALSGSPGTEGSPGIADHARACRSDRHQNARADTRVSRVLSYPRFSGRGRSGQVETLPNPAGATIRRIPPAVPPARFQIATTAQTSYDVPCAGRAKVESQ